MCSLSTQIIITLAWKAVNIVYSSAVVTKRHNNEIYMVFENAVYFFLLVSSYYFIYGNWAMAFYLWIFNFESNLVKS